MCLKNCVNLDQRVSPLFVAFWGLAVFFPDASSLTESLPAEGETG